MQYATPTAYASLSRRACSVALAATTVAAVACAIPDVPDPPLCPVCLDVAPADAIHVTPTGAATGDCGSAARPCALSRAIAISGAAPIALAVGDHTASVVLRADSPHALCGGYDPATWARTGAHTHVIASARAAVVVSGFGGFTLSRVDLSSPDAPSGESSYGVIATGGATLCVDGSVIEAGRGGEGSAGKNGEIDPSFHCTGDDGRSGAGGKAGASGTPTFDEGGFHGGVGTPGSAGEPGNQGFMADAPCGQAYSCNGFNGEGICQYVAGKSRAATPSCGGGGGTAGQGGGGGGASIAIYLYNAKLVARGSTLRAAAAGKGGAGGVGGAGSKASVPPPPLCEGCDENCVIVPDTRTPPARVDPGGAGGQGGRGGTGSDGWSCSVFSNVAGRAQLAGDVTTIFGEVGAKRAATCGLEEP